MYRSLIEDLKKWKDKRNRKPLILKGARQVGKSWLLLEFGRTCFKDVLYINFENKPEMDELFSGSIVPKRIIDYLSAIHNKKIDPENTLIIFDEVQEVPRALTSLKYFHEEAPEYAICCAGSLLGVALHAGTSFPVGKVEFLTLQPLSFYEFLLANDRMAIADLVKQNGIQQLPTPVMEPLTDLFKQYLVIGGMPKVVESWIEERDFRVVTEVQKDILEAYQNDFSKHAPSSIVPKLHYLWNSIPSQLAKENKKFVYGLVREGARAREYEDAILWLRDAGLVRRVGLVKSGLIPLKAYEELKSFKLYLLDVGLLRCLSGLRPDAVLFDSDVFKDFKGALTEQFVLQELSCQDDVDGIFYWNSGAQAEVDFVFDYCGKIIPVEAKAGVTVHAKSLKVFRDKYHPELSVKTSLKNLDYQSGILNVPLFLLWNLQSYLKETENILSL